MTRQGKGTCITFGCANGARAANGVCDACDAREAAGDQRRGAPVSTVQASDEKLAATTLRMRALGLRVVAESDVDDATRQRHLREARALDRVAERLDPYPKARRAVTRPRR